MPTKEESVKQDTLNTYLDSIATHIDNSDLDGLEIKLEEIKKENPDILKEVFSQNIVLENNEHYNLL